MASANVSLMDFSEDELESFLSGRSTDKVSATTTTGLQLLADAAALGNGVVDGESTRQQDGDGRHGVAVGEYAGLFAVAPHSTPAPQRSPALPDASLAPDTAAPVVPVPTSTACMSPTSPVGNATGKTRGQGPSEESHGMSGRNGKSTVPPVVSNR